MEVVLSSSSSGETVDTGDWLASGVMCTVCSGC